MVSAVITEDFILGFPTIIWRKVLGTSELNRELLALVREKQAEDQGATKSNVGGWHSKSDLLNWGGPAIEAFTTAIHVGIKETFAFMVRRKPDEFLLTLHSDAWANVNPPGASNKLHVHPNANLSGVYYVDPGDAEDETSGRLEFLDPRNRPGMFESAGTDRNDWFCLGPKAGMLVVFPSWLYHAVTPYHGTRDRVSIAFNAAITKVTDNDGNPLSLSD